MARLGSEKRPAIVRVKSQQRAAELVALAKEHGWHIIAGVEPAMPEDISDIEKLLNPPQPLIAAKVGRNDPCPCGSGKKYKKCCGREGTMPSGAGEAGQAHGHQLPETPAVASVRSMERTMADMQRLLEEQDFDSVEEANAYLQSITQGGGPLPHREPRSALEKAQDLIYDAWEERDPGKRLKLARRALEISPDCADAYVLLATEGTRSLKEACGLLAQGVAAGERAIGPDAFKEDAGHFWGIIETRPYMRARAALADCLWDMGQHREAIEHLQDMLRLNPNDNQGLRDTLLPHLLEIGDTAAAKNLLDRYEGDITATWAYSEALYAFQTEGDSSHARKLLAKARKANAAVPDYLLGRRKMPREMPGLMSLGSKEEAIIVARDQLSAWHRTKGALLWLEREGK